MFQLPRAASNQGNRRSLLGKEVKKEKRVEKGVEEKPKNDQAAQAVSQAKPVFVVKKRFVDGEPLIRSGTLKRWCINESFNQGRREAV
jgi:hypothetical protein